MSEPDRRRDAASTEREEARPTTAGGLLRAAREQQGVPVATVASALKVVPRRIEALESDRHDEMPDATFVRALAKGMARVLKIDSAPILALLPPLGGPRRLEEVAEGLNTPFRERTESLSPREWARGATPAAWIAALLVVASLGLYLSPTHWRPLLDAMAPQGTSGGVTASTTAATSVVSVLPAAAGSTPASQAVSQPGAAPAASVPGEAATSSSPIAAAPTAAASAPAAVLRLQASTPSWVEVVDTQGRTLISRSLLADETVDLDGAAPFRVRIGNARAMRLTVRGEPFDLTRATRDNIARLEVK